MSGADEDSRLKALRARIDALDEEIQRLVSERAACAREIAEVKRAAGDGNALYRPEREAEVLRRVVARNGGPLPDEALVRLFTELMSACRAVQGPVRVAYLGPEGTFTQEAALRQFGGFAELRPMEDIDAVFREVEAGGADHGVVPVENSSEGVVTHTLDRMLASPLAICGEVELRVHHNLLAREGPVEAVRRVYAHQQALAQCRRWLDEHLPRAERAAVASNAEAARRAADETGAAAVASEAAAGRYGLRVLARNIEDEPGNTTRFLVVGRQSPPPSGADKTSLVLSARNEPGALFRLLEPLARHGISMTRIESRPARRGGLWEYVFFVDIEGHAEEPHVAAALAELERRATLFRVLGAYPRALRAADEPRPAGDGG